MVEQACWWQPALPGWARRVYLGHETCPERLGSLAETLAAARRCLAEDRRVSFVTPFLTPEHLGPAQALCERLRELSSQVELVCGDWGLLAWLHRQGHDQLALSRLLTAQSADPRHARLLAPEPPARKALHLDGTVCLVRRRPPSAELLGHLRSCWADREQVQALLAERGVVRGELSALPQGLELRTDGDWRWSLHVPEVLLTVQRHEPDDEPREVPGWPTLRRRDNALVYDVAAPPDLAGGPIDRLVRRASGGRDHLE